jgi:valyl-tRNA synthetase
MVTVGGSDKMAKSVGNVLDVERAVDLHGRNAVDVAAPEPLLAAHRVLRGDPRKKRRSYERLLRLYRHVSGSAASSDLSDELAARPAREVEEAMRKT